MPLEEKRYQSPEFLLLGLFLLSMTIIICVILFLPFPIQGPTDATTTEQIISYRRDMFTAVITAFAAWIGAGAAYFFGRENLRQAIQAIKGQTPREILERKKVSELMMLLEPTVTEDLTIEAIQERLSNDPKMWYVGIVDSNSRLLNVIHEEAIQNYISDKLKNGKQRMVEDLYKEIMDVKIGEVVKEIKKLSADRPNLSKLIDIHVAVGPDENCSSVLDKLDQENKFVAFIVDANGVPRGHVTTGDLRRALFLER